MGTYWQMQRHVHRRIVEDMLKKPAISKRHANKISVKECKGCAYPVLAIKADPQPTPAPNYLFTSWMPQPHCFQ